MAMWAQTYFEHKPYDYAYVLFSNLNAGPGVQSLRRTVKRRDLMSVLGVHIKESY